MNREYVKEGIEQRTVIVSLMALGGKGFARGAMRYYEPSELPEYYALARHVAGKAYKLKLSDRLRSLLEVDDLTHAGIVRLLHDIRKQGFDPDKSKFSYFAHSRISYGIIDSLRKWYRVPQKAWQALEEAWKAHDNLVESLGREPSIEEWAEDLGQTVRELVDILSWDKSEPESLERLQENGFVPVGYNELPPYEKVHFEVAVEDIIDCVNKGLDEIQRLIFRLRILQNQTLQETAEILSSWFPKRNFSLGFVDRMERKTLKRITQELVDKGWPREEALEIVVPLFGKKA